MSPPSHPPRPPGVQAIFDELAAAPPAESLEALNRHLGRRVQEYNSAPQPELGGLSPDHLHQLLAGDWETTGALHVNAGLSLDLLRGAPLFADARTVMRYVAEHAPVPLTSRGNLTRAAVAALLPALRIGAHADLADDERHPLPPEPIRNEGDALWLVVVRSVLLFAKVLTARKGLSLSARGKPLLQDEQADVLYSLLFRTFFRDFDLGYFCGDAQATMAFSLHQLGNVPNEWTSVQTLAEHAWLSSARDPMSALDRDLIDVRHHAFDRRVLKPMALFGLLERRPVRGLEWWQDSCEYRRTPLYGKVLRFRFMPVAYRG